MVGPFTVGCLVLLPPRQRREGKAIDVARQPRVDMHNHAQYKYLLHLDGQSCSSRCGEVWGGVTRSVETTMRSTSTCCTWTASHAAQGVGGGVLRGVTRSVETTMQGTSTCCTWTGSRAAQGVESCGCPPLRSQPTLGTKHRCLLPPFTTFHTHRLEQLPSISTLLVREQAGNNTES